MSPWTRSRRFLRGGRILLLCVLAGLVWLLWPADTLRSDNFVFYFPSSHQVLPLEVMEGHKYLPLLQVLNLVGKVSGLQEKRNTLRVWFGKVQLDFRADERKVRQDKTDQDLTQPVRLSNGQWMVPVEFLTTVLPKLTHEIVQYQVGTNRIFVGDVKPIAFTVRHDQLANGARLTIQFTNKVSVRSVSQDGKWVMFLGSHPVEPLEPLFRIQDPYVADLKFNDDDGIPKLILIPAVTGLNFYPVMAEEGKVLLLDVLKPPQAPSPQPATPPLSPSPGQAPAPTPPAPSEEFPATPPGPPLPVVVLDAGHGGDDIGARSRDGVLEKDLVAQITARVRLALLSSQKFRVVLTRTGDANVNFEQREATANAARPAFFISFHAGDLGPVSPHAGIFVYQPPSPSAAGLGEGSRSFFVPWMRAQQVHLDQSRNLAQALQQQLTQVTGLMTIDSIRAAPVRSLRSVDAPAVALEVGRLAPDTDATALTKSEFQQSLASAIAQAIETLEGKGA